jgi:hypothetical protein
VFVAFDPSHECKLAAWEYRENVVSVAREKGMKLLTLSWLMW